MKRAGNLIFSIFMVLSLPVFAQTEDDNIQQEIQKLTKDTILKKLKELTKKEIEHFSSSLHEINNLSAEYVSKQKKICQGEYATVTINEEGETTHMMNALTDKEKKMCYRDLKTYQILFIEAYFNTRKVFLEKMHKRNLEELEKIKNERIQQTYKMFEKNKS